MSAAIGAASAGIGLRFLTGSHADTNSTKNQPKETAAGGKLKEDTVPALLGPTVPTETVTC